MSRAVELLYSRRVPHVAALALIAFGFAGCSGDMSTRLSNPFGYPPEGDRPGTGSRRRAARIAAVFPPASPIPVASPAAADIGAAVLSDGKRRRVRRRAWTGLVRAAGASAGDHRQRRAPFGGGAPQPCPGRHHY